MPKAFSSMCTETQKIGEKELVFFLGTSTRIRAYQVAAKMTKTKIQILNTQDALGLIGMHYEFRRIHSDHSKVKVSN